MAEWLISNNNRPLRLKEQQDCKHSSDEIARLDQEVNKAKEKYEDSMSRLHAQPTLDKLIKEANDKKITDLTSCLWN